MNYSSQSISEDNSKKNDHLENSKNSIRLKKNNVFS